jgi:serine/threonine-protein kinase
LVVRLGHGRLTQVFLATREVMPLVHEPVVVKQVHRHSAQDARFVQAFLRDAAIFRRLDHPRIIKILDAGVLEGHCFIAEEYLEGQPLRLVLRRAREANGLPGELAVYVTMCVLEGLHYAHEAKDETGRSLGIVHRDVSARNVFITNDGGVKISDFSIGDSPVHGVDRTADVWSAGALLWEALTGLRIFPDELDAASASAASKGQIPAASSFKPDVPAALDAILARALAWDSAGRYQTALQMQQDLEGWLASVGRRRDPAGLGALMRRLFANEVVEQRRLVTVLRGGDDPAPSSRAAKPTSTLRGSPAPPATASNDAPSSRPPPRSAGRPVPPPIPSSNPPPIPNRASPSIPPPPLPPSSRATIRSDRSPSYTSRTLDSAVAVAPDALALAKVSEPEPPSSERTTDTAKPRLSTYRSLLLFAVFCAGFSALVTYAFVAAMRSRYGAPQDAVRTTRELAEPRTRAVEPLPPASPPSVPNVESPAGAPTVPSEAPHPPATEAAATPPLPERIAPPQPLAARPTPGAPAVRQPPQPRRDDAPAPESNAVPVPESTKQAEAVPSPAEPVAAPGFLTVDTTPWSIVSENGKQLGQTPLVHVELSSGVHVLSLKNPELGIATSYTVTIQPGKTVVKRIGIE